MPTQTLSSQPSQLLSLRTPAQPLRPLSSGGPTAAISPSVSGLNKSKSNSFSSGSGVEFSGATPLSLSRELREELRPQLLSFLQVSRFQPEAAFSFDFRGIGKRELQVVRLRRHQILELARLALMQQTQAAQAVAGGCRPNHRVGQRNESLFILLGHLSRGMSSTTHLKELTCWKENTIRVYRNQLLDLILEVAAEAGLAQAKAANGVQ